MNLEDRARSATDALRRRAEEVDPEPVFDRIVDGGTGTRWVAPLLAGAGIAAVAVLVVIVLPLLRAPSVDIGPVGPEDEAPPSGAEQPDEDAGDAASCSAGPSSPRPGEQHGLPDAVAQTRELIAEAAADCDYDRLAELGGDLTYSFGEEGDPAGHLRRLEEEGERPLWYLRELLELPYAVIDTHGEDGAEDVTIYAWPAAHGDEATREDLEALVEAGLYEEEDVESWEAFGGYGGYRVGIDADGDWLFFVAGD